MKKIIILFVLCIASFFMIPTQETKQPVLENEMEIKVKVSGAIKEEKEVTLKDNTMESLLANVELLPNAKKQCLNMDRVLYHEDEVYIPSLDADVSLNSATQEELMSIKGIGPSTSLKIIEYRKTKPFESIEEIMEVKGIGHQTYLKIRGRLCI